jgi:hypothetical protein
MSSSISSCSSVLGASFQLQEANSSEEAINAFHKKDLFIY